MRSRAASKADPPAGTLLVAHIGAAHGLRGEVRVKAMTADPLAIRGYSPLAAADGRDFTDLDIGVWLSDAVPQDPLRAASRIADHLEVAVGVPVDVQILNEAPLTFA